MANERYVNSFIDLDLQEVHTKDEFFSFNVTPNNIKGKPNNPIEYSATISWKLSYFFQPIITNYFFKIKLGAIFSNPLYGHVTEITYGLSFHSLHHELKQDSFKLVWS